MRRSSMNYIAVVEKAASNYSAFIPDVPGAVGIGKTLEAAALSVAQGLALQLYELQTAGAALPTPTPRERLDLTDYEPEAPFELLYVEAAPHEPGVARAGESARDDRRQPGGTGAAHEHDTLRHFAVDRPVLLRAQYQNTCQRSHSAGSRVTNQLCAARFGCHNPSTSLSSAFKRAFEAQFAQPLHEVSPGNRRLGNLHLCG